MTGTVESAAPSTGGRLVYAVGDIHGYAVQLADLLRQISDDAKRAAPREPPLIVFLGDYVDRGPDGRAVIDQILSLMEDRRFQVVALKGNHEEALLRFLAEPDFAPAWIANWGRTTLQAYGVAAPSGFDVAACKAARARFAEALPASHLAFLAGLRLSVEVGDYLFVHAGVRPGVPLETQAEGDLIWIRHEFLESDASFGKVVVHGHTPADQPERKANRINVDTGVYFSGVLTAVRLRGEQQAFLQAHPRGCDLAS